MYLEGSDQHRGWFHSSLLESCGTRGHAPFKNVLTHGFVLDDKGYKMSKSQGNVTDPADVMKTYGADILRLWILTSDYGADIRIGEETLKSTGDLYRRIRNTFRFLLGALDGFTAAEKIGEKDYAKMPELEQYMLHTLTEVDAFVRGAIEKHEYGELANKLHHFCNNELSAFYFDIRKDRLYCDDVNSFERRACRTVLAHILECLSTWFAPILCFTAEEAWSHRPRGVFTETDSVHFRDFTSVPKNWKNDALKAKWEKIIFVRQSLFSFLEGFRKEGHIGSSLEAYANVTLNKADYSEALQNVDLAEISIVSQIKIELVDRELGVSAAISKAEGCKCERCWKVLEEVGSNKEHPALCNRCAATVKELKKKAA
jgi:isoleucyl-tRNA synthetase